MASGVIDVRLRAANLDLSGRRIEGLAPEVARWFRELGPRGEVDVDMSLRVPWDRLSETIVTGEIEAFNAALEPRGERADAE